MTALASCASLLIAAEGPFLRFYHAKGSRYITSQRVFKAQAVHGIRVCSEEHVQVVRLVIWGGRLVRALDINAAANGRLTICSSNVAKASDWIFDLALRPSSLDDDAQHHKITCVAVTAHNALLQVTIQHQDTDTALGNECAYLTLSASIARGLLTCFPQTHLRMHIRFDIKLAIYPLLGSSILGGPEPSPCRCWYSVWRDHLLVMV